MSWVTQSFHQTNFRSKEVSCQNSNDLRFSYGFSLAAPHRENTNLHHHRLAWLLHKKSRVCTQPEYQNKSKRLWSTTLQLLKKPIKSNHKQFKLLDWMLKRLTVVAAQWYNGTIFIHQFRFAFHGITLYETELSRKKVMLHFRVTKGEQMKAEESRKILQKNIQQLRNGRIKWPMG